MRDDDFEFPTRVEDELERDLDEDDDEEDEDEWECLGGARFYGTMRSRA
jgi:hypothetical protein